MNEIWIFVYVQIFYIDSQFFSIIAPIFGRVNDETMKIFIVNLSVTSKLLFFLVRDCEKRNN